jgi:hypothetical protein
VAATSRLWHVVVTVSGQEQDLSAVHDALLRLEQERPFVHSLRYDERRAEIAYWEEGEDMLDAASLALRMWIEHRGSARLPDWQVVGLEVVERETFQARQTTMQLIEANVIPCRF